jgi:putative spermidine/putrescine transport system substrate-binding protein
MMKKLILTTAAITLALSTAVAAEEMVFTAWGGTTQDLWNEHIAQPFATQSGVKVLMDTPTDYGKLKAMVESGNVTWDVVDVEFDFAIQAAKEGLLEPIDFSVVDRSKIDPRFVTDHAVGSFFFSFVLGYNGDVFNEEKPNSWADLFDVEKFPGKRAFYKWSAPGALEIALLVDGVQPEELYPLDLDRAFAKLDTIKDQILWWGGGAQSQQLLASGEAPLGQFWDTRVSMVKESGVNVDISWEQNLAAADVLVVPRGSKNKDLAMRFLAYSSSAQPQAKFAEASKLSPINVDSKSQMDAAAWAQTVGEHTEGQIDLDMDYWAAHRDEIAKRWYAWQAE